MWLPMQQLPPQRHNKNQQIKLQNNQDMVSIRDSTKQNMQKINEATA